MSEQPAIQTPEEEPKSRATLDYHDGYLCVMTESDAADVLPNGPLCVAREWYPVQRMSQAEAGPLTGRSLTAVDLDEGLYVDELGHSFQLSKKGTARPIDRKTISTGTQRNSTEQSEVAQTSVRKSRRRVSRKADESQLEFSTAAAKAHKAMRPASADRTGADRPETIRSASKRTRSARANPSTLTQRLAEVRRGSATSRSAATTSCLDTAMRWRQISPAVWAMRSPNWA
jgi:type IV secretory pathway VirB10-like protein